MVAPVSVTLFEHTGKNLAANHKQLQKTQSTKMGKRLNKNKSGRRKINFAGIENAVHYHSLLNVQNVVLDCQKCNQCLNGYKSLWLPLEGFL